MSSGFRFKPRKRTPPVKLHAIRTCEWLQGIPRVIFRIRRKAQRCRRCFASWTRTAVAASPARSGLRWQGTFPWASDHRRERLMGQVSWIAKWLSFSVTVAGFWVKAPGKSSNWQSRLLLRVNTKVLRPVIPSTAGIHCRSPKLVGLFSSLRISRISTPTIPIKFRFAALKRKPRRPMIPPKLSAKKMQAKSEKVNFVLF